MIELDLGKHARARVWLGDDCPAASYEVTRRIQKSIERREFGRSESSRVHAQTAAIEILIPHGGRFSYGLLGASFSPDSSGALRAIAEIDKKGGIGAIGWPLSLLLERVHAGLLLEFGESVLDSVTADTANTLGEGQVVFQRACYGEVGSSRALFLRLGSAVAKLLALGASPSEDSVREIAMAVVMNFGSEP